MRKTKRTVKKGGSSSNRFTDLEARIRPVAEVAAHQKALIYGRSGTGKTTMFGTFPKPSILLDVKEKGTKSIKKQEGVFVFPIITWADFEEIYYYLEANPTKYKTLGIDRVDSLIDLAKEKMGEGGGLVSRRIWGMTADLVKPWMIYYRDLDMNVVFISQDRQNSSDDIEDGGDILPEVGPNIIPSVAKTLTASVDIIGNTFIRQITKKIKVPGGKVKSQEVEEYCLRIGPHPIYLTKIREDHTASKKSIPKLIVNPTYDKLIEIID